MSRILVLTPWNFGWKISPQWKCFEVLKNDFKLLKFITLRTDGNYKNYSTNLSRKGAPKAAESTQ